MTTFGPKDYDPLLQTVEFEQKSELFDAFAALWRSLEIAGRTPEGKEHEYTIRNLTPPQYYPKNVLAFLRESDTLITRADVHFARGHDSQPSVYVNLPLDDGGILSLFHEDTGTYAAAYVARPLYAGHLPTPKEHEPCNGTDMLKFVAGLALSREAKTQDVRTPIDLGEELTPAIAELLMNSLDDNAETSQTVHTHQLAPIIEEEPGRKYAIAPTIERVDIRDAGSNATSYHLSLKIRECECEGACQHEDTNKDVREITLDVAVWQNLGNRGKSEHHLEVYSKQHNMVIPVKESMVVAYVLEVMKHLTSTAAQAPALTGSE